ncbi:ComEC/Rec2 family competence protein [Lacrimispora celerecrescens]|uniref:Competence protein ComEC n=1 Tax=[Clostridium] celerecrescens 18A TaxID=1286362 RepID=A0A2M8Z7U4_9FIRM|nr:ComEC/Rec2 family competence protein [Lacrimispora celerecrescens]PJJ29518.1 competence protein ComEC [[Clostridium] celerecrescens 18A]
MLVLTSWLFIPAFLAAGIVLYGYWRGRNRLWVLLPLLFLYLGAAWAGYDCKRWEERVRTIEELSGGYAEAEGRVSSFEEKNGSLQIVLKKIKVWKQESCYLVPGLMVSVKLLGEPGTDMPLYPQRTGDNKDIGLRLGQLIKVKGEIQPFQSARNPGEFDSKGYYEGLGIDGRFLGKELEILDPRVDPLLDGIRQVREWGRSLLYKYTSKEDAGVLTAAVLGDTGGLPEDIKSLYQKNGISHLLAISGMHMSFLGLSFYRILRKTGLGLGSAGLAGAVLVVLYGILTGSGPSVVRAVIMMSVAFMASYLGRTYDLLSSASLALLLLGLKSPLLLTNGGVQLSFGAVYAIGGAGPILEKWLGRKRFLSSAVSTGVAVQIVTMPITLYHFYQIPFYGLFLNLLLIPLMDWVVCSGIGIILLGSFSPLLGIGAAGTGHYILTFYEWICKIMGGLPGYSLTFGRPEAGRLAAYGLILFAGLYCLKVWGEYEAKRTGENKEEKKKGCFGLKVLILAGMYCFCILFFKPGPVRGLEAVFLDVGQGDGILLRAGRSTVLVDGGSSSKKSLGKYSLEPCLKSMGVPVIQYAFISHGDQDHLSGVAYLLENSEDIRIENLMLPYHGREGEAIKKLEELAKQRGTKVLYVAGGGGVQVEDLRITCLYPGKEDRPETTNEESEVLIMDYGNCRMLFTGDMEERGEEELLKRPGEKQMLADVNVLKVAHHGSKYSSGEAFLDAIKPRWAVVSYGAGNSYGHPHKEVLDRLKERGTEVFKTGEGGAIMMWTDGEKIRFESFVDGEKFSRYN